MATRLQACIRCAKVKRRCGKQTPRCLRCKEQNLECSYPPPKPTSFVLNDGEHVFKAGSEVSVVSPTAQNFDGPPTLSSPSIDADPSDAAMTIDTWGGLLGDQQAPTWFTAPDTWEVDHFIPAARLPPAAADLRCMRAKIDTWMARWVESGSNPFVHRRLYQTRFPQSIQDAYMTLSCYLQRTTANEEMIFRIIEDRSRRLVENHKLGTDSTSGLKMDPLEHLARVQALLVYQNISLYDGNIRLRHLAENHIPILNDWMNEMISQACKAPSLGQYVVSASQKDAIGVQSTLSSRDWEDLLWYSWILAESIRRTWIVASGVQGVYQNFQQPGAIPCKGAMKFTARQEVWEVDSAMEWEQLCLRVNVGLIHVNEAESLSTRVALEDISEFAMMILQGTWGSEKMRRWGIQVEKTDGSPF